MAHNLSKKAWLGVAREAGSPPVAATAPTLYIPQKSIMKGMKPQIMVDDERNTRDADNDHVDGNRHGEVDPKGNWYNDTSVYFMGAAFGDITTSQPDATHAATVYKHTFALTDEPYSMTLFKGYGSYVMYMAYSVVEKWTLKWSAENKLLEFDVSVKGQWPTPYTGTPLTPTYSSIKPFQGYLPKITLGGVSSNDISEMQIEFDQKIDLWYPSAGAPDFTAIYFGDRHAKCDFTARFDDTTIYDRYRTGQEDALVVDIQGALIANSGASGTPPNTPYYQELNLGLPVITYNECVHDTSKANVLIKAKTTAISNATGLITGWAQNTVASYVS